MDNKQHKKPTNHFAEIFAHITGPPTEIPVITFLILSQANFNKLSEFVVYFSIFLIVGWVVPIAYFAYAMRRGWIKDINATDRKDRPVPYAIAVLCWTILLIFANNLQIYANDSLLLFFYSLLFVIFAITLFYKVSVHAALNTALYLMVNQVYGWRLWWLFPLVLMVCWARWINKRHSLWQLIWGTSITLGLWGVLNLAL